MFCNINCIINCWLIIAIKTYMHSIKYQMHTPHLPFIFPHCILVESCRLCVWVVLINNNRTDLNHIRVAELSSDVLVLLNKSMSVCFSKRQIRNIKARSNDLRVYKLTVVVRTLRLGYCQSLCQGHDEGLVSNVPMSYKGMLYIIFSQLQI